jgi:hypothetical protein
VAGTVGVVWDSDPVGGRRVYWSATARGAALACLWWTVTVVLAGDHRRLQLTGPWLLLVGVLGHAVLWRPAVVVDDRGVVLRNVFRDVHVPWASLDGVRTRYALTLVVGGVGYRSWAAAAPGRPMGLGRPVAPEGRAVAGDRAVGGPPSRDLGTDSGAAAFLVESRWAAWRQRPASLRDEADPEPCGVVVRWNRRVVLAVALALALTLVVPRVA